MTVLLTLLLAAVLEEVLFRGGLQEWLWRRGLSAVWGGLSQANVLTSSAFALAHGLTRSWSLAACAGVAGLLLGWVYDRQRRLWPCMALHAGMNLVWWWIRPLADWSWLGA
ncbi:JDVT-CTERM system glutamic-type intramembrane protease [Aquabacterium sp.]|uniref:JDVT-CTERM system glutamic-type intramembrane protease MrtJ n=1 Tax=Aquabacterium sp. TaxID=1872578 RepID=UPI0035B3C832